MQEIRAKFLHMFWSRILFKISSHKDMEKMLTSTKSIQTLIFLCLKNYAARDFNKRLVNFHRNA